MTSLTGQYVGSLPYERMDAEVLEQTPTVRALLLLFTMTDKTSDDP
jgi:hypothetical protein